MIRPAPPSPPRPSRPRNPYAGTTDPIRLAFEQDYPDSKYQNDRVRWNAYRLGWMRSSVLPKPETPYLSPDAGFPFPVPKE